MGQNELKLVKWVNTDQKISTIIKLVKHVQKSNNWRQHVKIGKTGKRIECQSK